MVDWSASYQLGFPSTLVYFSYCKALLNSCCDLHHQARKGNQQHEQSPTKAGKIVLPKDVINTHARHWEAHLQSIADFLVPVEGV